MQVHAQHLRQPVCQQQRCSSTPLQLQQRVSRVAVKHSRPGTCSILVPPRINHQRSSTDHHHQSGRVVLVRAAKDGLDAELEATQKTLDKVLAAVQAAQQQQLQQVQPTGSLPGAAEQSLLLQREQQLWDRQQAFMDAMQTQWAQERQMFLAREQQLVSELQQLRQELHTLLLTQQGAAAAAAPLSGSLPPPPPAAAGRSSVASSPAVAPAAPAASPAASRPGSSTQPGQATVSGPSSASAAVAAAIRAVRDEGVTPSPPASPTASADTAAGSNWQDLFSSSGDRAVSSVVSAISAVDTGVDVLADLDLSYNSSSSSRGRRRLGGGSSNGSSNSSESSSTMATTGSVDDSDNEEAAEGAPSSTAASTQVATPTTTSSSSSSSSSGPVEVQKGDPAGPPPVLAAGDDDIFWVSKLHDGLMSAGFYPHDEEVENWLFSESTLTALLTFQACNGLPETGVTCEATWRQLMGSEVYEEAYGHLAASGSNGSSSGSNGSSGGGVTTAVTATEVAATGEVTYSFSSSSSDASSDASSSSSSSGATAAAASGSSSDASSSDSSSGRSSGSGWPVVMDMDGGREVHALQVCLSKAGYNCGDDDMRWWQFGSTTMDALKTFQACAGLPESGVCDERTWLALLGPEATPEDLDEIRGDESMYEDDMSAPHEGAVWLVGEQRWSKPPTSQQH